jgi:shikimate dehydrogenase
MTEITGNTRIIAHVGHPTGSFKAPMIYNPYFESIGLDAVVVPLGVTREDGPTALPAIFRMTNVIGALITMPHKVQVTSMLDKVSRAAAICGACNAVRRDRQGRLIGDMFDGEGFARGLRRKGQTIKGASALVVGCGGVGSAIAASLAGHGLRRIGLHDHDSEATAGLAARLGENYPRLNVATGGNDPDGFDIVVNATPLGMKARDPMPLDINRLTAKMFVGEVVMKQEETAFLAAARARGCRTQVGLDMLYEQIPAYLEFFDLPTTTPDALRAHARISY